MIRAFRAWRMRRWTLCKFCPDPKWRHHGVSWGTSDHCTEPYCGCISFVSSGVSLYTASQAEYFAQMRRSSLHR